jgi:hypothetical protein
MEAMLTYNPSLPNLYRLSSLQEETKVMLSYQLPVNRFRSSVHKAFMKPRVEPSIRVKVFLVN